MFLHRARRCSLGTVVTSDIDADAVYAFKSGSYTPHATLTNGVGEPISLLIAKP
jgi:hypothetical protein